LFLKDPVSESESGVVIEEREELSDKVDEDRELESRDMMSMKKLTRIAAETMTESPVRNRCGLILTFT